MENFSSVQEMETNYS